MKAWLPLLIAATLMGNSQELAHTSAPVPIRTVHPEYTKEASDAKIQGSVTLSAMVGIDGIPTEIKLVKGLGMGLDEKAIEGLGQWRFKPATRDSQPVIAKVQVEINFRPPNKPK